jgi:hypothetical protein
MRSTLEQIGSNAAGGGRIAFASTKLTSQGQFTVYLFHNHNEFFQSADNYPWVKTNGPNPGQVLGIATRLFLEPRDLVVGYSINNDITVIFETAEDSLGTSNFKVNNYIQHATAHEMGHQFSALMGNMAENADFTLAWQRDLEGMGFARSCKYNAHAANTEPPQPLVYDGIFTNSLAADGTYICGGDGQGFGGPNPLVVLGDSYPYFSQFHTKPVNQLPTRELFPEWFAYRAGFPDYVASDGGPNPTDGSNQVFDTSQALSCTRVYVFGQFEFGQAFPANSGAYSYPHSDTETATFFCDGTTTVQENPGS